MLEYIGYYIIGVVFMILLGSVYYHKVLYKNVEYEYKLQGDRDIIVALSFISWIGVIIFVVSLSLSYIINKTFKKGKDI